MANQIRITPDQMRQRANEYRAEADTVNGVISKMDSLLSALQGEWEGAASESYAARYQELKPGLLLLIPQQGSWKRQIPALQASSEASPRNGRRQPTLAVCQKTPAREKRRGRLRICFWK